MAIRIVIEYPGKTAGANAQYPDGEPRNITTPGDGTGTPWDAAVIKDFEGSKQAILVEGSVTPSGNPEEVGASDIVDALKTFLVNVTNAQTIAGVKTFGSIPIGPAANPTTDNELARKKYIDDLIAASGMQYSGASVFSGSMPISYTDLDLSSEVGSNRAMVFLSIEPDATVTASFRTNGEAKPVSNITTGTTGGYGSSGGTANSGGILYLQVMTDAAGVVEWDSNSAGSGGTVVKLLSYQVLN